MQLFNVQCVAIQVHPCLFSVLLSVMKGLTKTLHTSHYLSDNRFVERKFC